MGIMDNLTDAVVKKVSKRETIRLPYEQMTEIIKREYISGADDEFLEQVQKTVKGGIFTIRKLTSPSERYLLRTGTKSRGLLLSGRDIWIFDNEKDTFYQLDKDRHYKKLLKAVSAAIKMEKINRE